MINLGNIRFGLGVDTSDLDAASRRMAQFGNTVDRAAQQVGAGARQTEAALRRQEAAMVRGLQQVLNFNQAARRMNIPTPAIERANAAFDLLTQRMTRGQLTAHQYQRTMTDFGARMNIVNRELTAFKPTPPGAELKVWMQDIASAAVLAGGPLSGLGARITAISAIVGRSSITLAAFTAGLTAAAVGIYKLSQGAVRTSIDMERVRVRLDSLNTSNAESKVEFQNLQRLADQTGTSFITLADSYTRAKAASAGTALEGDKLQEVFRNLAIASAKFGLSQGEFEGTMRAVEQMISKGTVQAEELRGQMGDRLVGAFNAAAAAVGVTTKQLGDMMKKGQILTSEFLVPFSREVLKRLGGDASEGVDTLRASLGRLRNSVTFFQDDFDKMFGVSDAFKNSVDLLTRAIEYVTNNLSKFAASAGAVATAIGVLALPTVISLFISLGRAIVMTTAAMAGLNGAMASNPILGLITLLSRLAIAFGAGTIAFQMFDAAMADNSGTEALTKSVDEYIKAQEGAKTAVRSTTQTFIEEVQKQLQIARIQAQNIKTTLAMMDTVHFGTTSKGPNLAGTEDDPITKRMRQLFGSPETAFGGAFKDWAWIPPAEKINSATKELDGLNATIAKYEQQLKALDEIAKKPETGSNIPKMSTDKADTEAQIRRRLKSLREAQQAIQDVQDDIDAMAKGPAFFEEWKKFDDINDKVSAFRDRLTDAKVPLAEIDVLAQHYRDTLISLKDATEGPFAAASEAFNSFREAGKNAFQGVASAFAEAAVTFELSSKTFVDLVTTMVQKIIEQLLLLALFNPIMNSIFPGSSLPAFFDFGAKGMAFSGGVRKMAKGDILNGPTLFSHQGGMAVGGEAGTEAVMPLTRDSGGNLGVRAVGGRDAGDIEVKVFNRAPVNVRARKEDRGGGRQLILEIDEMVSGLIYSGNSRVSNALGKRGAKPERNLRS